MTVVCIGIMTFVMFLINTFPNSVTYLFIPEFVGL